MVKKAALAIARALSLTAGQLEDLSLLAGAYQVGKVSIPDWVLNKPGPLEDLEWKLVKKYPEVGYNIAEAIPQISHLSEAILSHHERWDGTGYPQGLSREDIPLYARIIAIADAYAAMVSGREYRRKLSSSQAVEEIKKNSGTQFDPYIVDKASTALEDCN
ncbi:MAG: HD domain-containing phosphohydrolase [Actinomycetota bacterium]|nr:HD domain-containing phosphohydrolase [Actinomycetota bacterium]